MCNRFMDLGPLLQLRFQYSLPSVRPRVACMLLRHTVRYGAVYCHTYYCWRFGQRNKQSTTQHAMMSACRVCPLLTSLSSSVERNLLYSLGSSFSSTVHHMRTGCAFSLLLRVLASRTSGFNYHFNNNRNQFFDLI